MKLSDLKALAEKAKEINGFATLSSRHTGSISYTDWMAAANPATVLKLIEFIELTKKIIDFSIDRCDSLHEFMCPCALGILNQEQCECAWGGWRKQTESYLSKLKTLGLTDG